MIITCKRCGETVDVVAGYDWDKVGNSTSDITPRKEPKFCPMCGVRL